MGSFMCTNASVAQKAHRKDDYKNPFVENAKVRRHRHREREANRTLFHKPRGKKEVENFHANDSHIVEHHDSRGNAITIQIRHARSMSCLSGLVTQPNRELVPKIPNVEKLKDVTTPKGETPDVMIAENVNNDRASNCSNFVPVLSARDKEHVASIYEVTNDEQDLERSPIKLKDLKSIDMTNHDEDNFDNLDQGHQDDEHYMHKEFTSIQNVHHLRSRVSTSNSLNNLEHNQRKSYSEKNIRKILNDFESNSRPLTPVDDKRSQKSLRYPSRTSIYSSQSRSSTSRAMELISVSSDTKV
ncbi:predicted protein [Naegleria gruberi]|uniref:Predicted protein n=1 Tax=Naegleria gruberi TaxID=5762 RepID=D2VUM4_NAEGR|nr:uncharacterized protein NAEGRDRAFT_72715 [Naegleria gruberi]EFC39477.1 predicted protein [Naegleria gruberi]|eukprot:XP_002672221.1 predicted protein [Naegleria gruberi strain NEG-M]